MSNADSCRSSFLQPYAKYANIPQDFIHANATALDDLDSCQAVPTKCSSYIVPELQILPANDCSEHDRLIACRDSNRST